MCGWSGDRGKKGCKRTIGRQGLFTPPSRAREIVEELTLGRTLCGHGIHHREGPGGVPLSDDYYQPTVVKVIYRQYNSIKVEVTVIRALDYRSGRTDYRSDVPKGAALSG